MAVDWLQAVVADGSSNVLVPPTYSTSPVGADHDFLLSWAEIKLYAVH